MNMTTRLSDNPSDDDFWEALGAIVGSLPMSKDSFVAVNQWMEATRRLIHLREG